MIDKKKVTCCVCMKDLQLGDVLVLCCPECQNIYDEECISGWLSDNDTCPCVLAVDLSSAFVLPSHNNSQAEYT